MRLKSYLKVSYQLGYDMMTIVIWGLGHAYIKRIKRGLVLFFVGLAIMFGVSFVIPFPFSLVVGLGYVI
jgi:hypothetical protein